MTQTLDYFKTLESQNRKAGAAHPDRCPKLKLHGVEFAIPPRGITVAPTFDESGAAKLTCDGVDDWPDLAELIERVSACIDDSSQAMILNDEASTLADLMGLARKAILRQYDLTDDQVGELLSFDVHTPAPWIEGLYRWAIGLSPTPSDAEAFAAIRREANAVEVPAAPKKRRWWTRG